MKTIIKGRREGKTTELIKLCYEKNKKSRCYIASVNMHSACMTASMARDMGLKIPHPITHAELLDRNRNKFSGISSILVDDVDILLSSISNGKVDGFSASNDDNDKTKS